MAPLKYEEQLKEKLENRRLRPSVHAWERLSVKLDSQGKSKRDKPYYWWFGIAASIIGVFFVVSQFMQSETPVEVLPKVVTTPEIIQQDESIEIASENNLDLQPTLAKREDKKANKVINKNAEVTSPKINNQFNQAIENVAKIESALNNENTIVSSLPKNEPSFETQKVQDVVKRVQGLKDANNEVTEAEINALLAEAQKEIALNRYYNNETKTVDAMALLQDVEVELLNESFRDKVFKALKDSFITVKTAVAQRNN